MRLRPLADSSRKSIRGNNKAWPGRHRYAQTQGLEGRNPSFGFLSRQAVKKRRCATRALSNSRFFSELDSSKNNLRVIRFLGLNCILNILVQILLISRNTWALDKFIFNRLVCICQVETRFLFWIRCGLIMKCVL